MFAPTPRGATPTRACVGERRATYIRHGYIRHGANVLASPDAERQLPLTPVVLHILLALADERNGKHGYAVAREVEDLTDGYIRMGPGTLYGSIQRMLDAELIEEATRARRPRGSGDDDERRRYYRVTAFGRRVLELELSRLADVVAIARRKQLLRPEPA